MDRGEREAAAASSEAARELCSQPGRPWFEGLVPMDRGERMAAAAASSEAAREPCSQPGRPLRPSWTRFAVGPRVPPPPMPSLVPSRGSLSEYAADRAVAEAALGGGGDDIAMPKRGLCLRLRGAGNQQPPDDAPRVPAWSTDLSA